jgi:type IV pilus assembly protein PilW
MQLSRSSLFTRRSNSQRGFSIAELLIGVAIGLFITGGIISVFASSLQSARRMRIEARVTQELRTAGDLVARDLRRARYWGNSINGTIASGINSVTSSNPYSTISLSGSTITYNFSRDATENDSLDANEQFGFKLVADTTTGNGKLQMQIGTTSGWQDITNPNFVNITNFTVTSPTWAATPTSATPVSACDFCQYTDCATAGVTPYVGINAYVITIQGNSTQDTSIKRQIQLNVRVRNDAYSGSCPTS